MGIFQQEAQITQCNTVNHLYCLLILNKNEMIHCVTLLYVICISCWKVLCVRSV